MKGVIIMRFISCLIALIFCANITAQNTDFGKMNKSQKEDYLIILAAKVTKTFGPDYYRETPPTIIEGVFDNTSDKRVEVSKNVGREYYTITFPYDKAKEYLEFDYSSQVKIWKDTGEPFEVLFGNGYGINFLFNTYEQMVEHVKASREIVPYQQAKRPEIKNEIEKE